MVVARLHQRVLKKSARALDASSLFDAAKLDLEDLSIHEISPDIELYMSPYSPPSGDLAHNLKSISDGQIVSMALLVYLQALLANFGGMKADWTPERRALVLKKKDGQKVYEARVDGYRRYQRDESNPIMAIIEVKPCI
ncbi:hypothetical protein PENCOP_c009G01196 [Penicillium coprophilum]|uniref:Uncharacterized protein n=1 Tax=Penicillium coprophilum TaxID=36646 RepID=A0A1V6UH74_9EURO|nr:hypothetical protein PENCOP_c009G01196 [Penicillium coprophilum]